MVFSTIVSLMSGLVCSCLGRYQFLYGVLYRIGTGVVCRFPLVRYEKQYVVVYSLVPGFVKLGLLCRNRWGILVPASSVSPLVSVTFTFIS